MHRRNFVKGAALLSLTACTLSKQSSKTPNANNSEAELPPTDQLLMMGGIPLSDFIGLSSHLTGEPKLNLSLAADYLQILTSHPEFAAKILPLASEYRQILHESDIEDAIDKRIMKNPNLRPAAEQIIFLWYLGALYVSNPLDPTNASNGVWQFPAPEHYGHGLVWSALGTHAPMTYGGVYGYWKHPPHK